YTHSMFGCTLLLVTAHGILAVRAHAAALAALRDEERRLSPYRDYRAFLDDEETRPAIDAVLALP
ncbi:hypothetical protein ACFXPJ_28290, partial [Streptomyces goshikiensis]